METKSISKSSGVSYSGEVNIKTLFGKRVMSERTIKNSGTSNLFKFIAKALAGDFSTSLRPCQIVLFSATYVASESRTVDDPADESKWQFDAAHAISPSIHYSITAVPKAADSESKATVTYTFRIPYSTISGTAISKMALYPADFDDLDSGRCAYIGRVKEDKSDWDPITIDQSKGDYILEVNWTMTIENR